MEKQLPPLTLVEMCVSEGNDLCNSQTSCQGDDMEDDDESDNVSIAENSSKLTDLYSLKEINVFLDETFNKSVKVSDYFSNTDKFIRTVNVLKRQVGFDELDEKKRFRLKKHLTTLRKGISKTTKRTRK